ncbi:MAG: hypothetical protein LQ351_007982 [Letrouitia transgressa]|nr:MAG: hypothetical protein LQ351_007982 [Letrouitia transgressa]
MSCQYIRTLHDVVGPDGDVTRAESISRTEDPPCLVFEWMEHDLRTVPPDRFRQNPNLPKLIAKSVISALLVLKTQYGAVHTDINPNNVFLSGIDTPSPVVKVGDLGNSEHMPLQTPRRLLIATVLQEGYDKIRVQSLPTRAPEVWRGLGCWHSSDVWSLGVTLVHWLSPSLIFGTRDKIVEGLAEAWCIAKIRRLIGPLNPPINNPDYQEEFLLAEHLESTTFEHPDTKLETQFIKVGTLRQELESLLGPKISLELIDFLEHILVVDHMRRPAASEALKHPYLHSVS